MASANSAPILGTLALACPAGGIGGAVAVGTAVVEGLRSFQSIVLFAHLVGGAGGNIDIFVQTRTGAGTWYDLVHFPTMTPGFNATIYRLPLCRYSEPGTPGPPAVIGTAGVPALAVNTAIRGDFGDAIRLVITSAAGTAAGTVQTVHVTGTLPVIQNV